jgi:hypothetical protein
MKHLFTVPGTRSTELATFEPLSYSDHTKASTESLFSLAPPAYKGLIEQIARLCNAGLNCLALKVYNHQSITKYYFVTLVLPLLFFSERRVMSTNVMRLTLPTLNQ